MVGIFLCREEGKVLEHIIHLKIEGMKVKPSVQLLKELSHEMDLAFDDMYGDLVSSRPE